MGKKLTIEVIKERFEKEDCTFLTTNYVNQNQKLEYICSNSHESMVSLKDWNRGIRCNKCAVDRQRLSIECIRSGFEYYGYTVLTSIYRNNRQKLDYICPNGHKHSVSWSDWNNGIRCPYCSDKAKHTIKFVRNEIEKNGNLLLTDNYINAYQILTVMCPQHHYFNTKWNYWQQGSRCPICAIGNNVGSGNPNWKGGISKEPYCQDWTKDLKEFVKQRDGYKCMNPYCTAKNPYDLVIHHINYNKKSCGPENLITLCRSCNAKANADRNWHELWYKTIINKRYNY